MKFPKTFTLMVKCEPCKKVIGNIYSPDEHGRFDLGRCPCGAPWRPVKGEVKKAVQS